MYKKAEKSKSKLRLALFGISGSGKTFTSLSMASGLGKKIAVIDTEHGSASKYADRFNFDVAELQTPKIENYTTLINDAEKNNYDVLIVDSLSHGWQELLEDIDKLAKTKYKGNSWSAWSEGTPKQKKFINAILKFNGHIIATMRSNTEYAITKNNNDKVVPVRIGLKPEQGKNIEYEFDMLIELSAEHDAHVLKDRTGKYQDKIIEKPGIELGKELLKWLNDGKNSKPLNKTALTDEQVKKARKFKDFITAYSDDKITTINTIAESLKLKVKDGLLLSMSSEDFDKLWDVFEKKIRVHYYSIACENNDLKRAKDWIESTLVSLGAKKENNLLIMNEIDFNTLWNHIRVELEGFENVRKPAN